MEQWASVMRKCVQYKRTEHWLATELCAYEERDAHLREANEKRKAKADEIQDNLEQDRDDDSDEEWDGLHHDTESMAEVRVYMNQLMKEHADAEKVREELKTKMDLIKETIQAERSEQNLRWCDAMRDLQDRMQEAGLLFSNFDAYREARNRIPAILRNSYMGGELPLQAWQHANIMEQRLDTASGPSSRSLIEPGIYTRDKVDRFNEAMLERNRAKYEFEQRHITYAHRKRKYEELVAQGLDVPTRTEFDREWVHELSRLTGDFIRAENDVVASKKSIKAFVAGSVLDGESIREPLSRRGNAAGEYLINEAHRSARILDWRSSLGRLASPESGRSPPATQYSADSLPFGFAESVTRDNEYRVSRANAFADLVMREEVHTVAWDVRVPGSEESAENRLPEVESKKTAKE